MTFVFLSFGFVSNFGFRASSFLFSFLGILCPVEYFHGRGVSVAPVTVFHGASHRLSDSSFLLRQAGPEPFLCQDKLRRREAKTAKKTILILFLGVLCVLCESHRLSDSLNPNSTENFKYVWLVLRR